jgi:IS30 family transposase
LDSGEEFAHKKISTRIISDCFVFAHPLAFLESGFAENTDELIHPYFPEHRPSTAPWEDKIRIPIYNLKNRPRKLFGSKASDQVCFSIIFIG